MGDEHALHRQCDGFGTSVLDFVFDIETILLTQMRRCISSSNKISHSNFLTQLRFFMRRSRVQVGAIRSASPSEILSVGSVSMLMFGKWVTCGFKRNNMFEQNLSVKTIVLITGAGA